MKPTKEMMEYVEKLSDVRSFISKEDSYSLVMPGGKVSTFSGEELIRTADAFAELLAAGESGDKDRKMRALLRVAELDLDGESVDDDELRAAKESREVFATGSRSEPPTPDRRTGPPDRRLVSVQRPPSWMEMHRRWLAYGRRSTDKR